MRQIHTVPGTTGFLTPSATISEILGSLPFGDSYSIAVLADSPLTYYRLEATSGTTEIDRGSLGLNGTYQNAPSLNQIGAIYNNPAVQFVRASSENLLGVDNNGYSLTTTGELSIEWWGLRTTVPSSGTFETFVQKNAASNGEWTGEVNDVGTVSFTVRDPVNAGTWVGWVTFGVPALGVFYHYVATMKNTAGTVTIKGYLNKVLVDSSTFAFSAVANGTAALIIGGGGGLGNFADATIDEFAIYGTELSATQIANHYNATGYDLKSGFGKENG